VRAVVFLSVAVLAAVGAALLLTRYMDAKTAAMRVPTARVVVAAVDIPVASPIKPEWLTTVDWPAISRPDGSGEDPQQVVGKVAVVPLVKGEAVLVSKLAASGGRSGLAVLLPPGARGVAVRVDDVVGVAGFIHPGDRVDVIVTMDTRERDQGAASKIILQNVKVLAVGSDLEHRGKAVEKAVPVTVATLMVTPEESEVLALGATKGKLLLALRAAGDDEVAATPGIVPSALLASAVRPPPRPAEVPRAAPTKRPQVAKAPGPAPAEKRVVEILRGDLFEKRDFERANPQ
jgi:pilus assembly protein CpaB